MTHADKKVLWAKNMLLFLHSVVLQENATCYLKFVTGLLLASSNHLFVASLTDNRASSSNFSKPIQWSIRNGGEVTSTKCDVIRVIQLSRDFFARTPNRNRSQTSHKFSKTEREAQKNERSQQTETTKGSARRKARVKGEGNRNTTTLNIKNGLLYLGSHAT